MYLVADNSISDDIYPNIASVEEGLKNVHNDTCYPALLVVGQFMEALKSGKYDPDKTALLITQTGGGCRATNYIALIRKALKDSGHPEVPVISLTAASGLDEDNSGFNIFKPALLIKALYALLYGDLIMQLLYRVRPYETRPGSADELYERMMAQAKATLLHTSRSGFYQLCQKTVDAFEALPLTNDRSKPRVGVVGEILVKFHPTANNQVVRVIEQEGCEANVPGLVDFFLFGMTNAINMKDELGTKATSRFTHRTGIKAIEAFREPINKMLRKSTRFEPYPSVFELAEKAGIDVEGLLANVDEYNEMCDNGWDDIFEKEREFMRPLEKGPFYCCKQYCGAYGTLGGVLINHKMEVMTDDYEVIPGLYCVGTDACTIYGDSYNYCIPGNTMGFCLNSGRIAGENAASALFEDAGDEEWS